MTNLTIKNHFVRHFVRVKHAGAVTVYAKILTKLTIKSLEGKNR